MAEPPNDLSALLKHRADIGVRAVMSLGDALIDGIEDHEGRIAILTSIAIQSIYCIAIELEERGGISVDEESAAGALKIVLDAFAAIAPEVVTVGEAIIKEEIPKGSMH